MDFNKYLNTLMTDSEDRFGKEGTDFASPDDRKGAAFGALQNQMSEFTGNLPQIPMRPEDQMEEPEVQEQVNDIVEADDAPNESPQDELVEQDSKGYDIPSALYVGSLMPSESLSTDVEDIIEDNKSEPKLSPQEKLLKEFRKYKQQREGSISKAREKDADIELLQNMNKAFQQIGTGLGAGYANVKMNPIELSAPKLEEQARQDQKDKLSNLMKEYKLLSKASGSENKRYFNTADGIVEVDQNTGETNLVRESQLKKQRENRLQEQFDFRKDVKGRLSDKEVKDITAFDDGMRILEDIERILQTTDVDKDLGPYASRVENLSDLIPGVEQDEDFVKMQQLVGIQLADYVKSISGAQVSEQEAQRLLKNIPNMTDKPNAFKTKLDTFRKELSEAKEDYLSNIGIQKESAKKFKKENKEMSPKDKAALDWANQNKDDPRSEAIIERLKAKGIL